MANRYESCESSDNFDPQLDDQHCELTNSTTSHRDDSQESNSDAESNSSSRDDNVGCSALAKKPKRLCKFRNEWNNSYSFISKVQGNCYNAFCTLCKREFTISHGGLSDVNLHVSGAEHKKNDRTVASNAVVNKFFVKPFTTQHQQVIAAELTSVYHAVKHHHSYASTDCGNKLAPSIFCDSEIAKKISCGRTKSEKIVCGVLAPKALQKVLLELKNGFDEGPTYLVFRQMHQTKKIEKCSLWLLHIFFAPVGAML